MPLMTGLSPLLQQPMLGVGQPGPTWGNAISTGINQGSAPGSSDPAAYGTIMNIMKMLEAPKAAQIASGALGGGAALGGAGPAAEAAAGAATEAVAGAAAETSIWETLLSLLAIL